MKHLLPSTFYFFEVIVFCFLSHKYINKWKSTRSYIIFEAARFSLIVCFLFSLSMLKLRVVVFASHINKICCKSFAYCTALLFKIRCKCARSHTVPQTSYLLTHRYRTHFNHAYDSASLTLNCWLLQQQQQRTLI